MCKFTVREPTSIAVVVKPAETGLSPETLGLNRNSPGHQLHLWKIEGFWVACGMVLLVGGVWTVLDLPWSLGPILVILLGAVLLGKAIMTLLHRA